MSTDFIIETKEVFKYYEGGHIAALNGVNIQVKKGEFCLIRGPSGSGKSTLLHLIGGLDSPSKGELFFAGRSFKQAFKEPKFRLYNIGFVFQAFYLWPTLNVLENVMLPLMDSGYKNFRKQDLSDSILEVVGLGHKKTAEKCRLYR